MISFLRDLMRRSASFMFAEPSPILRASSMVGSSQNFASPSGWLTWMCLRVLSREKKKNRNSLFGRRLATNRLQHLLLTIASLRPPRKGKAPAADLTRSSQGLYEYDCLHLSNAKNRSGDQPRQWQQAQLPSLHLDVRPPSHRQWSAL